MNDRAQLVIDLDALTDSAGELGSIGHAFRNAATDGEDLAVAVGHPDLAERIRHFSTGWDHERSELTSDIETLRRNLTTVVEGLSSTDQDLARALEDGGER